MMLSSLNYAGKFPLQLGEMCNFFTACVCQQIHISKTKLFMYIFYTKSSWKGKPFPWLLIAISEFPQINAHAKFKVSYTFLILWRQNDCIHAPVTESISHNNIKMTPHRVHRVLNHRQLVCSNRLFRLISKKHKLSALLVLCEENPSVTGGFSSQRASNVDWIGLHLFNRTY